MKKQIILGGFLAVVSLGFGQNAANSLLTTGNVGLGAVAPTGTGTDKLYINATGNSGIMIHQQYSGASILTLKNTTAGGKYWLMASTGTGNTEGPGHFMIEQWDQAANPSIKIPFFANGTTGNVGINTINTPAQLTVNGDVMIGDPSQFSKPTGYKLYVQTGILTEKVKVALTTGTDWSDYVFEKNYKLKSLEEVNSFITENKHLPNVPSAAELVEAGGFDLGKMDAKLLEKIEELTLYIIQLNEKNKELTQRLEKLEKIK